MPDLNRYRDVKIGKLALTSADGVQASDSAWFSPGVNHLREDRAWVRFYHRMDEVILANRGYGRGRRGLFED